MPKHTYYTLTKILKVKKHNRTLLRFQLLFETEQNSRKENSPMCRTNINSKCIMMISIQFVLHTSYHMTSQDLQYSELPSFLDLVFLFSLISPFCSPVLINYLVYLHSFKACVVPCSFVLYWVSFVLVKLQFIEFSSVSSVDLLKDCQLSSHKKFTHH